MPKIDQILIKFKPHPVVALVDDDPLTQDLLERSLGHQGYQIHSFKQAEALLEQYSKIQPDVLVMESVLPGMSSLSVLEALRPSSPEEMVPVLILSAKDDPRAKLLAFRRGASDYLTKPFDTDEISARVQNLARSKILRDYLHASSIQDPATSLENRRFLLRWLELEMARIRRYGHALACLLIEVDHFKKFEEGKEGRSGDELMKSLGSFLRKKTRASDVLGRLEEGRLLLLLPEASREAARSVAHRLRECVGAHPSLSMGIITREPDEEGWEAGLLVEKAEEALARAQSVGPGQTAVLS